MYTTSRDIAMQSSNLNLYLIRNLYLRKIIIIIVIPEKILFDSNFQYNAALANIALNKIDLGCFPFRSVTNRTS